MDNPFDTPTEGQGDWDSGLGVNFMALERGYHVTERAGTAINTGQVLWLNSGGFAFPFDPNSKSIYPVGLAYTAIASGDSATFLAWGIVRSLGINSPAVPGFPLYVSALTPGLIVTTPTGHKIGRGLTGYGVLFNPPNAPSRLGALLDVNTTGLSNGKILKWADATSNWVVAVDSGGGGGSSTLAGLTDVDTTGVSNGKALAWSDTSSKWVPTTVGGGSTSLPLTDVFSVTHSNGPGFDPNFVTSVTLTNSNRIATPLSGSPYNHVMGQPARYTGKRYYEFIPPGTSFFALGIVGGQGHVTVGNGESLGQSSYIGQIGVYPNGNVRRSQGFSAIDTIAVVGTYTASVWVGVAVDLDARQMWIRVNTNGTWNNSATASPITGLGGIDIRDTLSGASNIFMWPAANYGGTGGIAMYLASGDIGARIPIGFVAWADV